jgi:hypothetical protein
MPPRLKQGFLGSSNSNVQLSGLMQLQLCILWTDLYYCSAAAAVVLQGLHLQFPQRRQPLLPSLKRWQTLTRQSRSP